MRFAIGDVAGFGEGGVSSRSLRKRSWRRGVVSSIDTSSSIEPN